MSEKISSWKKKLGDRVPERLAHEIEIFETQLELRRQGKIDIKLFTETRLRRGVYGQRYDNGQRHDGRATRTLEYPSGDLLKGPATLWDAPGMQRVKIPFGAISSDQLETLAALAEEYADGVLHVTTRQDFQLHYVHIDDTPDLMRRLAAAGITTREACGNSVRNVTACPLAGVCRDQTFDVTPYAHACAQFLLGHPDVQDFGRKFKITFSGCHDHPCGLTSFHDLGFIARTRTDDAGTLELGFELVVGGGLGPVPHQAQLFDEFLLVEQLLPTVQAVCRVFARHGEKHNRARARLKFLVPKLGIERFRQLVLEERTALETDPRWHALLPAANAAHRPSGVRPHDNGAGRELVPLSPGTRPDGFAAWAETNVYQQRQEGYATATVTLPLGDLTSGQARSLATLAGELCHDTMRTTVEQNIACRWIEQADLPAFYEGLRAAGLHQPGASTIVDITGCPGTDTCKLGIASSRGLAQELRLQLMARNAASDRAIKDLRIKISGCFNSCGQHHVADIGFYGVSRKVGGRTVPHFQVVLGGQWTQNAGSFGLAIGAVPSRRIPAVVARITDWYRDQAQPGERFQQLVKRVGKAAIRASLEDLMHVPAYDSDPTLYSDWSDPREFNLKDLGVGECAGEVISRLDFELGSSERQAFEAQLRLEEGDPDTAAGLAYRAMLSAARALLQQQGVDPGEAADAIVPAFREHLYDTRLFFDPYAKGKFARYLLASHEEGTGGIAEDAARRRIEEAQLFIEACHAYRSRMTVSTGTTLRA